MGGGNINVSSTLVDSDAMVGKISAMQIKQVMNGKIDLGPLLKNVYASQKISPDSIPEIAGTMQISGATNNYVSPTAGKLIKSTSDVIIVTNMDMSKSAQPGMPSEMKMVVNMKVNVTKVK